MTVPKTIENGETITIPAGRVAVLPNVTIDGTLNIEGEVFIPSGSSVDFTNGIEVNGEKLVMSVPTAYHIYNGSVEATNTVLTNGFSTTLYTGNGSTQSVTTGVDMSTQWGNDASETFGGLIWLKGRSGVTSHRIFDTVRGAGARIASNLTDAEAVGQTAEHSSFNNNGFSVGSDTDTNTNTATYASWNFQTTHRRTRVSNHGKTITEHYNPTTGFTIIKYEGSGLAGHEIAHSLGRKLGFVTGKNLSAVSNWLVNTQEFSMSLNLTNAATNVGLELTQTDNFFIINGSAINSNTSTNQYIMYGWANSYYDEAGKLIGNYEVGVYQGTGAAGNKVTTRGKPAWVMLKRLDSTGSWVIYDNQRATKYLLADSSQIEFDDVNDVLFNADSFSINSTGTTFNASGGQYLYMVVYDNDSGSGKSKYPKAIDTTNLSINALVPYANGIDINGSKVSIDYKNETITGLILTEGKNYPYSKNDGTYGVSMIAPSYGIENPLTGDFFNLKTLKWYDNTNNEITPRTYLDCVVYADQNGQVTYVEELPKIEYKDIIKANEYQGKNACTAYAKYDTTTTPPTFKEGFNAGALIRTTTGEYDFYTETPYDTLNACPIVGFKRSVSSLANSNYIFQTSLNKFHAIHIENGVVHNGEEITIHIFGGKN